MEMDRRRMEEVLARPVTVRGPIEENGQSHPFSAMEYSRKGVSPSEWGYEEEEYFISGMASVYDMDEKGQIMVVHDALPYTTRLLIRRPSDRQKRRPRVIVDILNASNGYDIEDQWRRSWLHIMENGYSYVGITSKPINVLALKYFDYERYKDLNWAGISPGKAPAVPDAYHRVEGCEAGLIWDMLGQLGMWIRGDGAELFSDGQGSRLSVYLTGQSQSGMYLNTYVNQFHPFLSGRKEPVFDGYLSLVSGGKQRSLRQVSGEDCFMELRSYPLHKVDVPYISLSAEGDFLLFEPMGGVERGYSSAAPDDKRYYCEVAGAPHTDAASPLVPVNSEIVKCKCPKRILDGAYDFTLNDFPLDYVINAMLERLHLWAAEGILPKQYPLLETEENGSLKRDAYGNVKGGIRTPFLEVPAASYLGSIGRGETNGSMERFDRVKMREIYGTTDEYRRRFQEALKEMADNELIVGRDYQRAQAWMENTCMRFEEEM